MNSRHRRALEAVFADPISASVAWSDVEALLIAVGCKPLEGSGSRVRLVRDGVVASVHRPHPQKEAKRYQMRDARDYLVKLGIRP